MSDTDKVNPFDPFGFWKSLAPQTLTQPILPGLFGVTINEANSSAPDTEQKILAKDSYGRQIGKLMDAVAVLIESERKRGTRAAEFNELINLKMTIDDTKAEAARDRLKRLKSDLASLKNTHAGEYHDLLDALRALIDQEYGKQGKS